MILKLTIAFVLLAMVTSGAMIMRHAASMPAYIDPREAELVRITNPPAEAFDLEESSRNWHAQMDALRTRKWDYYNFGRGLIVLSVTFVAGIFFVAVIRRETVRSLKTPMSTRAFLAGGSCAVILAILTIWQVYPEKLEREMFPPWADTVAIPIFGGTFVGLLLLLTINVTGYFFVRNASLPAPLWIWNPNLPRASWVWSLVFGSLVLFFFLKLVLEVIAGTYLGPLAFLVAIYISLSARAIAVSRTYPRG